MKLRKAVSRFGLGVALFVKRMWLSRRCGRTVRSTRQSPTSRQHRPGGHRAAAISGEWCGALRRLPWRHGSGGQDASRRDRPALGWPRVPPAGGTFQRPNITPDPATRASAATPTRSSRGPSAAACIRTRDAPLHAVQRPRGRRSRGHHLLSPRPAPRHARGPGPRAERGGKLVKAWVPPAEGPGRRRRRRSSRSRRRPTATPREPRRQLRQLPPHEGEPANGRARRTEVRAARSTESTKDRKVRQPKPHPGPVVPAGSRTGRRTCSWRACLSGRVTTGSPIPWQAFQEHERRRPPRHHRYLRTLPPAGGGPDQRRSARRSC